MGIMPFPPRAKGDRFSFVPFAFLLLCYKYSPVIQKKAIGLTAQLHRFAWKIHIYSWQIVDRGYFI